MQLKRVGIDIITAMNDPKLFGLAFQGSSWDAWRVALKALFGLPLSSPWERKLYRKCTGRSVVPKRQVREGWFPTGRRGGKSIVMAAVAVFVACFRIYAKILAPGERGKVVVVAADRQQARVVFGYIEALLDGSALLREMVLSKTRESISLRNRIDIEVHTSSFRSVRGYTVVAFIGDECAFWRTDDASANPDTEIVNAARPAMATVPGALLLMISSPYARRGALWNTYQRHFGQDASTDVLVWQADSRTMNPTLPQSVIDKAFEEDATSASAEYGAAFRRDVEMFIPIEVIEACVVPGRTELPPLPETEYIGFAARVVARRTASPPPLRTWGKMEL